MYLAKFTMYGRLGVEGYVYFIGTEPDRYDAIAFKSDLEEANPEYDFGHVYYEEEELKGKVMLAFPDMPLGILAKILRRLEAL